jgi:hypothetical protein
VVGHGVRPVERQRVRREPCVPAVLPPEARREDVESVVDIAADAVDRRDGKNVGRSQSITNGGRARTSCLNASWQSEHRNTDASASIAPNRMPSLCSVIRSHLPQTSEPNRLDEAANISAKRMSSSISGADASRPRALCDVDVGPECRDRPVYAGIPFRLVADRMKSAAALHSASAACVVISLWR